MPGKIIEDVKYQQVYNASSVTATSTLYNGSAAGVTGVALDTQDYDELNVLVNTGTFTGNGTLDVTLVTYATDDSSSATAVSGCTFTQITTANDAALHTASLVCDRASRYVWVKTVKGGSGNCDAAIVAVLGKGKSHPESNSPVFDVDTNS